MASALLVSEQNLPWDVLAPLPSAVAAWDNAISQDTGTLSSLARIEASTFPPSSPFDCQSDPYLAESMPAVKGRPLKAARAGNAQEALAQIRSLQSKREKRRREEEEIKWISVNRARFAGRWVALLGADLIAVGDSAKEVAQAAAAAPSTPLVVYIDVDLPFAGW